MFDKLKDIRVWMPLIIVGLIMKFFNSLSPEEFAHVTGKDSIVFWFGFPTLVLFLVVTPTLSLLMDLNVKKNKN